MALVSAGAVVSGTATGCASEWETRSSCVGAAADDCLGFVCKTEAVEKDDSDDVRETAFAGVVAGVAADSATG